MKRRTISALTVAVLGAGALAGFAATNDTDSDVPITGDALRRASDAALEHTGQGDDED